MSEYHARLSPSSAHRYMRCVGAPTLEARSPRTSSIFADEGTAAHKLATMCLEGTIDADDFLGEFIRVGERRFEVTKDMVRYVQLFIDDVRDRVNGGMLLVEVDVPIGHVTGEDGATGRSDVIIVDTAHRHLIVDDLKYGAGVEVEAEDNEQAQKYALGALEECSVLGDFDTVTVIIHQPRIREKPSVWGPFPVAQLTEFAAKVRRAADMAREAESKYPKDGLTVEALDAWAALYLTPGEKQCRFCDGKASCPALRNELFELVGAPSASAEDFAQFVPDAVDAETGDNWLTALVAKADMYEGLFKAARAELARRLLAGHTHPDWKLVEGKQGDRKWVSEEEAVKYLKGSKLPLASIYEKKLIGPATAEKLLKKSNPARWAKSSAVITRAPGKPSVAPATDKRPAISITATAADFADIVPTDD